MKLSFTIFLLSATALLSQTTDTRWETRLQQIQINGAAGPAELVANQGNKPSLPVGIYGSRFELWGYKYTGGVVVDKRLLAPTEVGTYKPILDMMVIQSSDPTPTNQSMPFPRTRFDKPFNVHLHMSGLLADGPDVPLASQSVEIEHYVDLYEKGKYNENHIESSRLHKTYSITKNGTNTIPFSVSNLTSDDIAATRSGRERFEVFALEDGDTPRRLLGRVEWITIHPIATAVINQLDSGITYPVIPGFSFTVERGYPSGSTWAEMYKGSYVPGKRGTPVGAGNGAVVHGSLEPFFGTYEIDSATITQPTRNGDVTIVIRTSSPFPGETRDEGGIELTHQTIKIQNNVNVRSMISTAE